MNTLYEKYTLLIQSWCIHDMDSINEMPVDQSLLPLKFCILKKYSEALDLLDKTDIHQMQEQEKVFILGVRDLVQRMRR